MDIARVSSNLDFSHPILLAPTHFTSSNEYQGQKFLRIWFVKDGSFKKLLSFNFSMEYWNIRELCGMKSNAEINTKEIQIQK